MRAMSDDDLLRDLESKRVEFVHRTAPVGTDANRDPVWKYIGENYAPKLLMLPCMEAGDSAVWVWKRSTPFGS